MNYRRTAAVAALMLATLCASATEKENIRIKVLNSETRSMTIDDSGVPKNCDQVNFDAYCNNSKSVLLTNTLTVQEGNQPPFRVSCNIDTRWSRCIPLPKGESYDARLAKHGIVIYYVDDKGKVRSQLYTLTAGEAKPQVAAATAPAPVAVTHSTPAASALRSLAVESSQTIKCSFTSTPPGAEINLDGNYVGNTPSEIAVSTGTHVVVLSMPGFAQWRRDLKVAAGSEAVNVTASLQKTQP